ncbi:MAG TPA: glycosyltransferase family 2 protein [Candidatus Hypogeohydataceae bacterium YC41]
MTELMTRPPISVCIITYNEEKRIRQCLESVKWVEELVVVDSHSTDRTVEICKEYTPRVYQRDWPGHVEQKNFALSLTSYEWALCLDADECLSPELSREIQEELSNNGNTFAGYIMPRHTYYLGRWINHGGWYPDYKLRLFKRSLGKWGGINPHDKVVLNAGATKILRGELLHFNYEDITSQIRTIDSFSRIFAQTMLKNGVSFSTPAIIASMLLKPPAKFLEMYILKRGFLDGMAGFIIASTTAFYIFLKYAKWWEAKSTGNSEFSSRNSESCILNSSLTVVPSDE